MLTIAVVSCSICHASLSNLSTGSMSTERRTVSWAVSHDTSLRVTQAASALTVANATASQAAEQTVDVTLQRLYHIMNRLEYNQWDILSIKDMTCRMKYLHEFLLCRATRLILLHFRCQILCFQCWITLSHHHPTMNIYINQSLICVGSPRAVFANNCT